MTTEEATGSEQYRRSVKKIWNTITKKSRPRMVFSILGNSEYIVPNSWPRAVFLAALIDSARNAGASKILYRNGNYAVSDIIKEAQRECECTLDCDSGNNKQIQFIDIDETFQRDGSRFTDQLEIETVINARSFSKFELEGSGKRTLKMRMPLILVVLEGDLETVRHVTQAVDRVLPVLLFKGTGQAADLIANFLDGESTNVKEDSDLFGMTFSKDVFDELNRYMLQIKERSFLVKIFDVKKDDPSRMSTLAGDVIVKAWSLRGVLSSDLTVDQKPIAQDVSNTSRNCPVHTLPDDTNLDFTLTKWTSPTSLPLYFYFGYQFLHEEKNISSDSAQNLLLSALLTNRTDYVQALLNKGVLLKQDKILRLYKQIACMCSGSKHCSHIAGILKANCGKSSEDMETGWNGKFEKFREDAPKLCRKLLGYSVSTEMFKICRKCFTKTDNLLETMRECGETEEQEMYTYLLLWALLSNRKEIAFVLWQMTDNHLLTGLVSTAILRKLQEETELVKEVKLSREVKAHADVFQERCLHFIDLLYTEYPDLAMDLMKDQHTVWSISTTPLQFAHENQMFDVVAHPCAQKYLNEKWFNGFPQNLMYFLKAGNKTDIGKKMAAPFVKFLIHNVIFMAVILGFSSFALTDFGNTDFESGWNNAMEYCIYFWMFGDFIEESVIFLGLLKTRRKSHRGFWKRFMMYIYDLWNALDFLSYLLLVLALVVRLGTDSLTYVRRIYTISLLVMYLRFLQIFLINKTLGTLLIMFKEMLKDLFYFLLIALVLITGVGVYYHANIWPNHASIFRGDFKDWRIWDILYYPYWQMYGEGMNEYLEGRDNSDCTSNYTIWSSDSSVNRCPGMDPTVPVVAAFYMLISNLLLVNLVIAMFSHTFNEVKQNSERLWCYERYNVITDYMGKVPSPFNIFIRFGRFVYRRCCKKRCCSKDKISNSEESNDDKIRQAEKRKTIQHIFAKRLTLFPRSE